MAMGTDTTAKGRRESTSSRVRRPFFHQITSPSAAGRDAVGLLQKSAARKRTKESRYARRRRSGTGAAKASLNRER
jgi:hypothetical protein